MAEREASVNIVATIAAELLQKEENYSKKSEINKKSVKQIITKNSTVKKELKDNKKEIVKEIEEVEEDDDDKRSLETEENDEEQVSEIGSEIEEEEEEDEEEGEEEEDDDKHESESIYEDAEVIDETDADIKDIEEDIKDIKNQQNLQIERKQKQEKVEEEKEEEEEEEEEGDEEEDEEEDNEEKNKSNNNIDSNEEDNDNSEEIEEEEEEIEEEEEEDTETEKQEQNKTITAKTQSVHIQNQKQLVAITDNSDQKEGSKPPIKAIAKSTNTTKEADYFGIQKTGESPKILPLLQGLLHKNSTQANNSLNKTDDSVIDTNSSLESNQNSVSVNKTKIISKNIDSENKGSDKMSNHAHHVEDSGTESGEDLKLIAAGLRDSIQLHSMRGNDADSDLIAEVTTALNRLEASLKEGNDLKMDSKKRIALLSLVDRLQTGLTSPDKISAFTPAPDQASGELDASSPDDDNRRGSTGRHRFAKRRNRANRHTVGVSREELADARRYMEEMVMIENLSHSTTPDSNAVTPPEFPIKKQQSAGSVLTSCSTSEPSPLFRPNQFVPGHLKDSSSLGNTSKSFQAESQPVVQMREKKPKYKPLRQSISVEQPRLNEVESDRKFRRPLSESYSIDINQKLHNVLANQPNENYRNEENSNVTNYRTPEEKTVYEKNLYNQTHHSYNPSNDFQNPQTSKMWQPSYDSNKPDAYTTESAILDSNKANRFINKKLMMKRANTIDIPKPMKYMHDNESDSETDEKGINSTRSIGLRGTVQVNIKNKRDQVVPEFEPKTENDRKFLAFIQKQNPSSGLGWNNPLKSQNATVSNWSNKFGSIKNSFESGIVATSAKPPMPTSSARNFWKKAETNTGTTAPALTQRRVPFSSKANDRIVKPPWTDRSQSDDELIQSQRFREQPSIQAPKPILVNKFSHAPLSAFKPIATSQPDIHSQFKPIHGMAQFNTSPTKQFLPFANKNTASPTSSLPWASKPNVEHRVQNVATKFESKSPTSTLARHQSLKSNPEQNYYYPEMRDTRIEYKRPSLPDTSKYNRHMEYYQDYQNVPYNPPYTSRPTEFPPLPYVCTDYTQPGNISTYATDNLNDSITNPRAEPIVLSTNRPVISPRTPNATQQPMKLYDFPSISDSLTTSPNHTHNEITDDELDTEPLMEYKVESKVMKGPIGQTAVTVGNRTNRVGDEKDSKAAQNLLMFMKNIGNNKSPEKTSNKNTSTSKPTPAVCMSPDGSSYKAPKVDSIFSPTNENASNRMPIYQSQNQNPVPYGGYQPSNQNNNNTYSSVDFQSNLQNVNYPHNLPTYQNNPVYMTSEPETAPHFEQSRNEQSFYQKPYSENTVNENYQQKTNQKITEQTNSLKKKEKLIQQQRELEQKKLIQQQRELEQKKLIQQQKELEQKKLIQQQKELEQKKLIQQQREFEQKKLIQQQKEFEQKMLIQQQRKLEQKKLIQQQRELEQEKLLQQQREFEQKMLIQQQKQLELEKLQQRQNEEKQKREMYEENKKLIAKQTKVTNEKQQVNTNQTQVYKSSQPTDTPDIVKSSLPKEDIPILKKFGPAQPHLYTPNAYQGTVVKASQTQSSSKTVTTTSSSLMRKFSDPAVKTKSLGPEIIETPATPKDEIPSHIVYNKVSQFSSMARNFSAAEATSTAIAPGKFPIPNARPNPLSKSDSWHQIVQQHQQASAKPSSPVRFNNSPEGNQLRRAKSGHTLNVPKMYEAGLNKTEIVEKQKTVAAYFSGQKSPNSLSRNSSQTNIPDTMESLSTKLTATQHQISSTSSSSTTAASATGSTTITSMKKSSINRVKTSEKASIQNQNPSTGICRSQTMPHIANINLLDESNVEDAFEQLLKGS